MSPGRPVLITGANGFVGRALCARLLAGGIEVRATARRPFDAPAGISTIVVPTLDGQTQWAHAVSGCSVVLHLAARVHVMRDSARDPVAEFRRINTQGTLNLARQAAAAGVKRFVFMSSIGVNGVRTLGKPFTPEDAPAPHSPYALSKMEAEQGLRSLAEHSGLEVVIVRPPLIYGPGAPGNFELLAKLIRLGTPLPLGAVENLRSLVSVDNVVDLLAACVDHRSAVNRTFLVSDGEDLSTADLVRRMAQAMGRPARLFALPPFLLRAGLRLLGKGSTAQSLLDSLQVDSTVTRKVLGWTPPISLGEGLCRALKHD